MDHGGLKVMVKGSEGIVTHNLKGLDLFSVFREKLPRARIGHVLGPKIVPKLLGDLHFGGLELDLFGRERKRRRISRKIVAERTDKDGHLSLGKEPSEPVFGSRVHEVQLGLRFENTDSVRGSARRADKIVKKGRHGRRRKKNLVLKMTKFFLKKKKKMWVNYRVLAGVFLIFFDGVVSRNYIDQNTRWFLLHAFANFIMVMTTLPDLAFSLFVMPFHAALSESPVSLFPSAMSMALHLYHVAMFRNLTWLDWLHHGISAFSAGLIALCFSWGPLVNAMIFFLTGLPGGIDYFMLFLVKTQRMDSITEKKYNTWLNLWVRMPGLIVTSSLTWSGLNYALYELNMKISWLKYLAALFVIISNAWNGIYFMHRVVVSYTLAKHRDFKSEV
jgi:hypothetical protein